MIDAGRDAERLSAESIEAFLDPRQTPSAVHVYASVSSTNDLAKELALAGAPSGAVVVAESQTAGRGRMGRSFYSPSDSGVYLSMVLRPRLRGSQILLLTSATAVAAARAIEQVYASQVQIKWVNDLYHRGKKVAGILLEAFADPKSASPASYVIVGVGINVKESDEGFPAELAGKAGVLTADGEAPSRSRLAAELIRQLWRMAEGVDGQPELYAREIIEEARRRSCVLGRDILVNDAEGQTRVRALDLDEQGFLIVEDAQGARRVLNSGEISLTNVAGESWC